MHKIVKRKSSNKSYVGYCQNNLHRGFLTAKTLKDHDCLGKNCRYLQKYENHGFWVEMYCKRVKKKLVKWYKKNWQDMTINCDYFLKKCKSFYGSYAKVQISKEGILLIDDFISNLKDIGLYNPK